MEKVFLTPFWRASLFLSSMIMGVGMYGIPYVFSRAGFFLGLIELFLLAGVTLLVHLMYGEIVLRTKEWHRLPGYAKIYLGARGKKIALISWIIAFPGALGAYVLLGGQFLSNILPGSPEMWSYVFLIIAAFVLFFGVRFQAKVDTLLVSLLGLLIIGLGLFSFSYIQPDHFTYINLSEWFVPYGIIMYALAGMAAVPDMVGILEHHPRALRRAIVTGTLMPVVLYLLFAITVVGISGPETTEEAIRGLTDIMGAPAGFFGSIIGVLSTFGVFIAMGTVLKAMFHLDVGFSWRPSWFLVILAPFLFIFLGFKSYLPIIGFLGSVSVAVDGLMTLLIYKRAILAGDRHAEYSLHVPVPVLILLSAIFASGIVYEIFF